MEKVLILLFLSFATLIRCTDKVSGTTDETLGGTVVAYKNGQVAVNAEVKIFNSNDTSKIPIAVAYSDSKGRIAVKNISNGYYNFIAKKDSLVAYDDSLYVNNELLQDTLILEKTGSVKGIIRLQPNDDPRSVYVQAIGTDLFSNVDKTGDFTLNNLGKGDYTLRIVSSLNTYTPKFVRVRVLSDSLTTLKDTIDLHYQGIPVITGLSATFDKKGVIHLLWNKTDCYDFKDYVITQTVTSSIDSSGSSPIKKYVKDTVYDDTLTFPTYLSNSMIDPSKVLYNVTYTVVARNNLLETGLEYKNVTVAAMPSEGIRPESSIKNGTVGEKYFVYSNATKNIIINVQSAFYKINTVTVFTNSQILKSITLPSATNSYQDSIVLSPRPDTLQEIYVKTLTEDGTQWTDSLSVIFTSEPTPNKDSTLIGKWDFNEGSGNITLDSSGHLLFGVIEGAQWREGVNGSKALHFGGNDKVVIANSSLINPSRFTISLWASIDNPKNVIADNSCLFSKFFQNKTAIYSLGISNDFDDAQRMKYCFTARFGGPASSSTIFEDNSLESHSTNWVNITAVFARGDSMKLYINGKKQSTVKVNAIGSDSSSIIIGNGFTGLIDEIQMYSRELTDDEIMLICNKKE